MSTIIETDLKELLAEIKQQLNEIQRDTTDLKVDMSAVKTDLKRLNEDVRDIKNRASTQIWALIITVIGAVIAAITRFVFFPNP